MKRLLTCVLVTLLFSVSVRQGVAEEFRVVRDGRAVARLVVEAGEGGEAAILQDAADWLSESIRDSTGVSIEVLGGKSGTQSNQSEGTADSGPTLVLTTAAERPELARRAGLSGEHYDAYRVVIESPHAYLLGSSAAATRHAVADLLHQWGFRWFAPSPHWHHVPVLRNLSVTQQAPERPALVDRRIWYAYGMRGDDLVPLMENYQRWAIANRLSVAGLANTGHSYGNIIGRNQAAFEAHPEYYALLDNGRRDSERAVAARKFCVSNPGLVALVVEDRLRLLREQQKRNPAAYMVSVDPSDGEGTCQCDDCQALGTPSDRVFHLANEVARGLRAKAPEAWVGLYAYSSHRLPPTIEVESNVYVQVAMGFNRTQYTLPELVERWSEKVGAVGLREYYGVEAWDWGLPGRMRGGKVAYHRRWIPYYAQRKLNAINAETNSNWGGQTPGLYVAAQLMWDPEADVDRLTDEFFTLCYGAAADTMRRFHQRLDEAPALRPATLVPLLEDVQTAWDEEHDVAVRRRLVDLQAYLLYVVAFREFDLVRSREPERNDAYYAALKTLMEYAWQIRHRDVVHYYALARRLCNGLPVSDDRPEFYMFRREAPPVWQNGEPLSDDAIRARFMETMSRLRANDDPTLAFSRYLDPVRAPGDDAGSSGIVADSRTAVARFRGRLRGYLVPSTEQTVTMAIAPTGRQVQVTVYLRGDEILWQKKFRPEPESNEEEPNSLHAIEIALPKANEYRVEFEGDFELQVSPETPFVFEASVQHPAWISYSGPHYFYVPRGTRELVVDMNPRLSLMVPGAKQRTDLAPANREPDKQYAVLEVPEGADGRIWHTTNMTRGQVMFLNVPPLLSFHRETVFVPREVSEADR